MREIKFRAWHKEKNIMVYDNEDDTYGYWDGCCNSNVGMENTILNSKWYKQYNFMQYTGLKDKNGKEIYEGDILRIKNSLIELEGEVIFDTIDIAFEVYDKENDCKEMLWYTNKEFEVIGNIYDNKDLLEKGKEE